MCRSKPIKKGGCHLRRAHDEMLGDPDDEISCVSLEAGGPLEPPQDYKYFQVNDLFYIICFFILWLFSIYISSENAMNCIDL